MNDIKIAEDAQTKYWAAIQERTTWFKKHTILEMCEALNQRMPIDTFIDYNYNLKKMQYAIDTGYDHIAKWWASQIIDSSIDFVFTSCYKKSLQEFKLEGVKEPSKKAMAAAEKAMNEYLKCLKTWAK